MTKQHHQYPAFRFVQGNRTLFLLALPAGELLKMITVDAWDPMKKDDDPAQGYQRLPARNRCIAMGRYLVGKNPLVPLTILISARKPLRFEEANGHSGVLTIPDSALPLNVVDGQHRLCGFRYVIEEGGRDDYAHFMVPVTIAEGVSKFDEMMQFHMINTTQKGVRTDLVRRLLVQQVQDRDRRRELVFEGREWEARAAQVTVLLNERADSPWKDRIQAPNAPRLGTEVIKETSFATSLKPILDTDSFTGHLPPHDVAELLVEYWKAWRAMCPEAFDDPYDHVIQKTPGVFSLHIVATRVLAVCQAENDLSLAQMERILRKARVDSEAIESEFWARERGKAAAFGSMKGFRMLADLILEELPAPRLKRTKA